MEVKIRDGVSWNTEPGAEQTEGALEWMRKEIYGQLAANPRETDKVIPTTDRWGRPVEWMVDGEGWRVSVRREYVEVDAPTWSRRRDIVRVDAKGGEA